MQNTRQDFSWKERLIVVAILFFLGVIAIQNLMVTVTTSEEETVKSAAVEYATVRNMYAAQNEANSFTVPGFTYADSTSLSTDPVR